MLTRLNQRYLVGRTLGKPGGFGVTYLGFDVTLRVKVAIKEYCPRGLVGRDASRKTLAPHSPEDGELFRFGLQAFLDEARILAKFDHANVVRVRDFFEANGTAYLVMDYYEGESLLEYLARQGGTLPWRATLDLMLPVLDGLREVHRHGFLHRDIKPHNIYLTTQGRPILLDFGSARQAMGERSRSLSVVLTEGYAPFEQYHSRGQQGPWTDIYGAAATIYLLLTGQTPPPAPERVRGDGLIPPRQRVPDLPPPLNAALMSALAMDALQRPQTMEQFEEWLHRVAEGKAQPPVTPVELSASAQLVQSAAGQKKGLMIPIAVVGLIGVILLMSQINRGNESVKNASQKTEAVPQPTVVTPVTPPASANSSQKAEVVPQPTVVTPITPPTPSRLPFDPEMVKIPSGCFQMGSPSTETGRGEDESQHQVCVGNFEIGRYEVTQAQWQAVMGDNPSSFQGCANCPVEEVSWNDVQYYLEELNRQTGQSYRLPTEAEWEYACRGGVTEQTYCGGNDPDRVAWYDGNSGRKTHPVGQKAANGFGLYDLSGNAWEWTCSAYDKNYGGAEKECTNKNTAGLLAVRGGSWSYLPTWVRSAYRFRYNPTHRHYGSGFRLARSL